MSAAARIDDQTPPAPPPPRSRRMIRLKEVLELVPLGRSTIYERMAAGTFPRARDLGGHVIAWYEADILEWLETRPETGQDV